MKTEVVIYSICYNNSLSSFSIEILQNEQVLRTIHSNVNEALYNLRLSTDKNYLSRKYGFTLSEYEMLSFVAVRLAIKDFIADRFDICLIIERTSNVDHDKEQLILEVADLENWDIYFPFDRTKREKNEAPECYQLGHVWGLEFFFLSRNGARILSNVNVIKQALDEEILELITEEKINVYYQESEFFKYKINYTRKNSRNEAIKSAILKTNFWTNHEKEQIRLLLKSISSTALKCGTELIIGYGSLLGYVRHNEIMPWDDDVDLLINKHSITKFLSELGKESKLKYDCFQSNGINYYKIWICEGRDIPAKKHKFPFVDIWIIEDDVDMVLIEDGLTKTGIRIPKSVFYPLQLVSFEGSSFYAPKNVKASLDFFYADWRTEVKIYIWSHQKELPINRPLRAKISVDDSGKIIF